MNEVILDCTDIQCPRQLHRLLAQKLQFPEWYGSNLDALYDCLTELSGKVRLLDWEAAEVRLGDYGKKVKKAIATAALQNADLDLYI